MENIHIVDDHRITSLGIGMVVKKILPSAILHFSDTYPAALKAIASHPANLIILDLSLPGGTDLEMIKELRSLSKDVKILIFSGRDELLNAPGYLDKGANGYLAKTSSQEQTEIAIKAIINDQAYVSDKLKSYITDNQRIKNGEVINPVQILSVREKQVFDLLMSGKWTKEISEELNVRYTTVSTQKAAIYKKFGVNNIVSLVRRTLQITNELKVFN